MRIKSILIANRGEIACRIIRTARALGLRTIAVYSQADMNAPHVSQADDAVLIGAASVTQSYLVGENIIEAALKTGADAIHPGYGFLSENAGFAAAVEAAGLVFIGPSSEAIAVMGNKAEAKRAMLKADVPCVPGYEGEDQSEDAFREAAQTIGFPIMVKAAAGGGGRGMRLVHNLANLPQAIEQARSEAENAFGSGELILEKAILQPRHVEVQVFADSHGNYIHLGERDCSVQRRHQKVIEEAPSPAITPQLREQMGSAAIAAAKAVKYVGAGTVEFLFDNENNFYFLEMNTRLQVEHPVTEMVTGLDLVALQIAVAQGEHLPVAQSEISLTGHAIEARLYAEDPAADFLPVTGKIELWKPPDGEGIRVDDGIATSMDVTPFYDPMLAKIIACGPDRHSARSKLIRALEETVLFGPSTNTSFLVDALSREAFRQGSATTAFIAENYPDGVAERKPDADNFAIAAALAFRVDQEEAFHASTLSSRDHLGWCSSIPIAKPLTLKHRDEIVSLAVTISPLLWQVSLPAELHNDQSTQGSAKQVEIEFLEFFENTARLKIDGRIKSVTFMATSKAEIWIAAGSDRFRFERVSAASGSQEITGGNLVTSPMPGTVIDVLVEPGQTVSAGDSLAIVEAMKMQHQIKARIDGRVKAVVVSQGNQLASGDLIVELEDDG